MDRFNLKEYLNNNIIVIKYLGLWPKEDYTSNKLYLLYTVILNGFFNFPTSVGLLGYLFTSEKPLEDAISAGYVILGVMATIKTMFIMKYSKMFKLLVVAEAHKSAKVELNQEQNNILCDYVGFWKKVHLRYSYLSVLIIINYIVTPFFNKSAYTLPLRCWYPFDYKKPIIFEMVYFHQTIAVIVDVVVNLNGATLTAGFLAYLAAECDVLTDILRNLKGSSNSRENLKSCVEYHKKIIRYSKMVESYFSKYLLIQFVSSCVSTAFIMTSLTKNDNVGMDFWFLSILQLGVWADLYIYCWYGNEVTEKSKHIPYAAFESNWTSASREFKRDMLFFICRTQRPIQIFAVDFFALSLNTFIDILRMAYSYFMLLSQLSKGKQ